MGKGFRWVGNFAVVLAFAGVLSSCGGGGGSTDSSGTTPPPPVTGNFLAGNYFAVAMGVEGSSDWVANATEAFDGAGAFTRNGSSSQSGMGTNLPASHVGSYTSMDSSGYFTQLKSGSSTPNDNYSVQSNEFGVGAHIGSGEQNIQIYLKKPAASMSNASLSGKYWGISYEKGDINGAFRLAKIGPYNFDGSGGCTYATTYNNSANGANQAENGSGTYAVSSNGSFATSGGHVGGIGADGSLVVSAVVGSTRLRNMSLFIKAGPSTGYTNASLSGTFRVIYHGQGSTWGPSSGIGTLVFDGAGAWSLSGRMASNGAVPSNFTSSGTYSVNPDGTFSWTQPGEGNNNGAISSDGNKIILANVTDVLEQEILFGVKASGVAVIPSGNVLTDDAGSAVISNSGAVLNGRVNPGGIQGYAWFEYGIDPGLAEAMATDNVNVGTGSSLVPVQIEVRNLNPGTPYYFRVVLHNINGLESKGDIATFTTTAESNNASVLGMGMFHTFIGRSDGVVGAAGYNVGGQLGDGSTAPRTSFVPVLGASGTGTFSGFTGISGGNEFSLGLKSDGTAWAWGSRASGRLGDGSDSATTYQLWPSQVKGEGGVGNLSNICRVVAGGNHSVALTRDGYVLTWGLNIDNQLGRSAATKSIYPGKVKGPNGVGYLTGITSITGRANAVFAMKADGSIWFWGQNTGNSGTGLSVAVPFPTRVKGAGGVGYLTNVNFLSVGPWGLVMALKNDGTVWTWGLNNNGQLGIGSGVDQEYPVQVKGSGGAGNLTGVLSIAAGYNHALAMKGDGSLWAWGSNAYGQLGNNSISGANYPIQVMGPGGSGYISNVKYIEAGFDHNIAVRSDMTAWMWGRNSEGQLGLGNTTQRPLPTNVAW